MEEITVLTIALAAILAGLVGLALYLQQRRALAEFEQRNLNYRAEIKAGPFPGSSMQQEPAGELEQLMSFLGTEAGQNILRGLAGSLGKKQE